MVVRVWNVGVVFRITVIGILTWGFGEAQDAVLMRPPDRRAIEAVEGLRSESIQPTNARWDPVTGRLRSLAGEFPLGKVQGRNAEEVTEALRLLCLDFIEQSAGSVRAEC